MRKKSNTKRNIKNNASQNLPLPEVLHPAHSLKTLQQLFLQYFKSELFTCCLPTKNTRGFYSRLFSPLVTLWYFIFMRLRRQGKLQHVINDVQCGGGDFLSPGDRRLSKIIKSWATSAWSDARKRLPLTIFSQALNHQATQVSTWAKNLRWKDLWVQVIDGTTVRLRPFGDIPDHFPAHRTRRKNSYWCLARVVVSFCAQTALATGCAIGACQVSEQALACQIILQSMSASLYIGDRNFGVYRIIQAVIHAKAHALVRMTEVRARKLAQGRSLTRSGDYDVKWKHSRHDQCLEDIATPEVSGRLIVMPIKHRGYRTQWLFLFTTLTDRERYSAQELVALYYVRWEAELNLRSLKTNMDMDQLEVQSADMAQKEWWAGLLAYNLVRTAMLIAALQSGRCVKSFSFASSRDLLFEWLKEWGRGKASAALWTLLWKGILGTALPKRKRKRPSEPRAKRSNREHFPILYGSRQQARERLASSLKSK